MLKCIEFRRILLIEHSKGFQKLPEMTYFCMRIILAGNCHEENDNPTKGIKRVIGLSEGHQKVFRGELWDHFCSMTTFYLKVVRRE